jgi:glycosyltransferase involved in cell wall biosynthesis
LIRPDTPRPPASINGRFATQALSGVQRFAIEITRALQAQGGYELITPPGGRAAWPQAREAGRRQGQAWEQLELPRAAAGTVLLNLGNTAPLLRRRQLIVIHDAGVFSTPEAYSKAFRSWYKLMQGWLARSGVPIVTVSEFSRREILAHLPAKPAQVAVMPEGADHMDRIDAAPEILARHNLARNGYVLCVGTLAAHKNLSALSALAQALAARNVPLVMVGGLGGAAFQGADTSRLPQPARYIGRVSDAELKALYQAAGCFVFPSRYEGFGLPAVEAMACGCPVVAADISALREACGDAAAFCNPAAPEDIAVKVLALLDDPAHQASLRQRGTARAAALTWRAAAARLHSILEQNFGPQKLERA